MPRWALIVLLAVAVLCAGIGTDLTDVFAPAGPVGFGWTAYSPLSSTEYSAGYEPLDRSWLILGPRIGAALLALGAGGAGACITALVVGRRRRPASAPVENG